MAQRWSGRLRQQRSAVQSFIEDLFAVNCVEKTKIKKKEAVNGPFVTQRNFWRIDGNSCSRQNNSFSLFFFSRQFYLSRTKTLNF